jgi:type I restriction enzyme S subunit
VYYNDVIAEGLAFMPATAPAEQIAKFTLRAGDTIITKDSETADDIAVSAFVPVDLPGVVCGYHLSIVRPREGTDGAFIKRFFDSIFAKSCFAVRANGLTRVGLGQYELDNVEIPFPPVDEQATLAAFLDRETAKIDALVAEQRRLIELLKEKRQAVISHVVTKGLNSDAPMNPSDIDWLGSVPAHWRVARCGFYSFIQAGLAFPSEGFSEDESGARLLRGVNVAVGTLRWNDTVYWQRTASDGLDPFELRSGDIVIGMDRPYIKDGMRIAVVTDADLPCLLLQRVARLTTGPELDSTYMLHLLGSNMFLAHFEPETTGVSVPHISPDQIANFVIPIPHIDEQRQIVEAIAREADECDSLTAEAERAINLLEERRTALISAVVTGHIDVRGLVPSEAA